MAVYTVLEGKPSGDVARDAERVIFVREGFAWVALFVPLLWLLWHRLWLVALGWLILAVALQAGAAALGGPMPFIAALAFNVAFALEANALRRWTLERRGYRFVGVAAGANRDECERRFFATWLIGRQLKSAPTAPGPWSPTPSGEGGAAERIIGLFPTPERPR
jgi:hypothetical protein